MIDILVISHATFRAVNRSVFNLLKDKFGLAIEIVAPRDLVFAGKRLKADPPTDDCEILHYLELAGDNPRTYFFKQLPELLDKLKPKVVYLENDPISLLAIKLGRWCQKNKSKLISLSCENLAFGPWASYKRIGWKGFVTGVMKVTMMHLAKNNIHHVFTINNAGLSLFKSYGFSSVSKTPLGFNPTIFHPDHEARQKIRQALQLEKKIAIAYIGRMVPEKGVDLLLKALKQIEQLEWVLILDKFSAAAGPYQKFIVELIEELQLQDKVKYFDADHKEISQYMNAADIVVIPSVSSPKWVEQYGRVAPESMACGKLVIAADTGALPELVGNAGLLFEEGNIDHLANIIKEIILAPDTFQHFASKAEKRAHQLLSIEAQATVIFKQVKAWI